MSLLYFSINFNASNWFRLLQNKYEMEKKRNHDILLSVKSLTMEKLHGSKSQYESVEDLEMALAAQVISKSTKLSTLKRCSYLYLTKNNNLGVFL